MVPATVAVDPSNRYGLFGDRADTQTVAVYRFNVNHWTYDQAYAEMKDYDFYTRFGHGDLKTFVGDYAQKMLSTAAASATSNKPRLF